MAPWILACVSMKHTPATNVATYLPLLDMLLVLCLCWFKLFLCYFVCVCQKCHPECSEGCTGTGAKDCLACKHYTNETDRWDLDTGVAEAGFEYDLLMSPQSFEKLHRDIRNICCWAKHIYPMFWSFAFLELWTAVHGESTMLLISWFKVCMMLASCHGARINRPWQVAKCFFISPCHFDHLMSIKHVKYICQCVGSTWF